MNRLLCTTFIVLLVVGSTWQPALGEEPKTFQPKFFAFQTGFRNAESKDVRYLSELVEKSGFDGVELMGLRQVDAYAAELAPRGLKIYSLYLGVNLDKDPPYDPKIKETLTKHKGNIPYIWLHIGSRKHGKSDPAGDERCVEILRDMADWCDPLGVKIGIYHHVGQWSEKFSDAVRIARKVDKKNVGAVFNLCHYLRTSGPDKLEEELASAFPHVAVVSINGADAGDTKSMGWDRLIQPLGQGSFDVKRVLKVLKEKQYAGPIGLQGFGVRKKPEDFFPSSVKAYRAMLGEINGTTK